MYAKLKLLILGLVVVAFAATTTSTHAEDSPPLPPLVDLSLETRLEPSVSGQPDKWVVVVNNIHDYGSGLPPVEVRDVKVRITTTPDEQSHRVDLYERFPPTDFEFDAREGIWTIPSIPTGGSATAYFRPSYLFPRYEEPTPVHVYAEIVDPTGAEPQRHQVGEAWYIISDDASPILYPVGDVAALVSIDDRSPAPGEQATFMVSAKYVFYFPSQTPSIYDNHVEIFDVKVKVELSPGLSFADPAMGTSDTYIWEVGDVSYNTGNDEFGTHSMSVPVLVTRDNTPLDRRCLTATIINAIPDFKSDPENLPNNIATVCLGEVPPLLLMEGEIDLWWLHDCVGSNNDPCGGDDELKLLTKLEDETYLNSDQVIVQVRDPDGRTYDGHSASITSAGVVSWQTANAGTAVARQFFNHTAGVSLIETQEDLASQASNWQTYGPFTVTKGQNAPGHVKIRISSNGNTWFDPNPSATQSSFTNDAWLTPLKRFVEFETLGMYELSFEAEATRTDGVTKYAASGTHTFYVGPIAELEVRDGGASPLASGNERAYTITARNNGPDPAKDVEVALSGIPEGARVELEDHHGAYRGETCQDRLCSAVWDIGEMRVTADERPYGRRVQFPTLTLIVPAAAPVSTVKAAIASVEDYSVVIDGTTHSTHYLDHIESNDRADIEPLIGTGDGVPPGTPRNVRTIGTSVGTLVLWDEVEYLNLWPVTHYEVKRGSNEPKTAVGPIFLDIGYSGGDADYRVRSVNEFGVTSRWSQPPRAVDPAALGVTVEPTQLTVAKSGNAARASYTVVLDSAPTGAVNIALSNSDASKVTLNRSRLVFGEGNWNVPQTVTATWVDGSAPSGSIVTIGHTVSGGGYDSVTVDGVTVTALDSVLNVNKTMLTVAENGGEGTYTIALTSQPSGNVIVDIVSEDASAATVQPPRLVFDGDNWSVPRTMRVTGVNDEFLNPGGSRDTRISHRISGGGLPTVTAAGPMVTVTDDDQAGLSFDTDLDGNPDTGPVEVKEENGGTSAGYRVRLSARPENDVIIDVTSTDIYTATVDTAQLTFTPTNWMDYQPVTVTGVNDDLDNPGDQRDVMILHTSRSDGYRGLMSELKVVVKDDDASEAESSRGVNVIRENGGKMELTFTMSRQFTEVFLPLCLSTSSIFQALAGSEYMVTLKSPTGGARYASLTGADTQRPVIRFGDIGAGRVVLEFTGLDNTDEEGRLGYDRTFKVDLCEKDPDDKGDLRNNESGDPFASDTTLPFTVTIVDDDVKPRPWLSLADGATVGNVTMFEGDKLKLQINLSHALDEHITFVLWRLANHYPIEQQALPSHYSLPGSVTIPAGQTHAEFTLTSKLVNSSGRSTERKLDIRAERPRGDLTGPFFRGMSEVKVTIIDNESQPELYESCASYLPSDAVTVSEVTGWRDAHDHNAAHVLRWNRVLAALGVDNGETPMTVAESKANESQFISSRWNRVTRTLQGLEQCTADG